VPDPRLGVKELIKGLEPEMAKFIWVEETKNLPAWPPRIGDTDDLRWVDPVFSVEGRAIWIYHSLRKSNKGFTRDQAIELAEQTSPEEFDTLFALQVEMLSDPKSRADRTPEADGKVTQKPEVGSV
jgi:hypothetical protein